MYMRLFKERRNEVEKKINQPKINVCEKRSDKEEQLIGDKNRGMPGK